MDDSNKEAVSIPYYVHEGYIDRMDRTNRRLVISLILTIVLMFATNAIWVYEWTQYDYVDGYEETITTQYEQDGSGINIMGDNNEVNHGTEDSSDSDEAEDEEEN